MIRTQLYIPEALYANAKLQAELEGVSVSVIVRRYLDDGLRRDALRKQQEQKKKKGKGPLDDIIGTISVKRSAEAALNHNDIYDYVLPWDRPKGK